MVLWILGMVGSLFGFLSALIYLFNPTFENSIKLEVGQSIFMLSFPAFLLLEHHYFSQPE